MGALGAAVGSDLGLARRLLVVIAAGGAGLGALAGCESKPASPRVAVTRTRAPRPVSSNIAAADYIGPRECGDCHSDEYERWSHSLHRVMNARGDDPGAVIGDFGDAVLRYAGGQARFSHDARGYVMTMARGARTTRYRVTRTIGRRGLQEYVGIEEGRREEVRLPFGWWPRRGGWYPQPYFDPWLDEDDFDAYAPVREPWAGRCPWCHSTYPFAQRIARSSGPAHLGHGMEQLFTSAPGGERLVVAEQVTTGISCESCHLGGRDHAAAGSGGSIHFVPQGAQARRGAHVPAEPFRDERRDPDVVNAVCAQCHSGPSPRLADHTALRNSSEALDLGASPCRGIKCTDCHDPHRADSRADEGRAVAACTHCHDALAEPAAAAAHAGTGHGSVSCLDCHMPRMVMGIDRMVRTHRISSPTDPAVLGEGGPNACNLCHLDRSIAWTAEELARGWEVRLPIARWELSYRPGLDTPVGEVWLASAQPAFRLLAEHAYARSPLGKAALPRLYDGLADPLAYVRTWSLFAIEDILGHTVTTADFDPRAEPAERARQLAALRRHERSLRIPSRRGIY